MTEIEKLTQEIVKLRKSIEVQSRRKTYTIDEVGEVLHKDRDYVSALIKDGKLKAIRLGRPYVVPDYELDRFLKENIGEEVGKQKEDVVVGRPRRPKQK